MARHFDIRKAVVPADGHELKLLILLPKGNRLPPEKTPGILWIHGGGYAVGMAGMVFMSRAKRLVTAYGAVVVSPEYRLAGKAPYPAALEDCYAALLYLKAHAEELGCAADRIMVGGESAGGGLTAALCMLARDRGEVNIAFQMPLYPMLDDRDTDSSKDNHGILWNTRRNHAAWRLYLREVEGEIPPYASTGASDGLQQSAACIHVRGEQGAVLLRNDDVYREPAQGWRSRPRGRISHRVPRV